MKNLLIIVGLLTAVVLSSAQAATIVDLAHRYSFTTDTSDSVGNANLSIVGSGSVSSGAYDSPGGAANTNYLEANGASMTEIGNTLSSAASTGFSFEFWFSEDVATSFAKLLITGQNTSNFVDVTPAFGGGAVDLVVLSEVSGNREDANTGGVDVFTDPNQLYYLSASYDNANNMITATYGPAGGAASALNTVQATMSNDIAAITFSAFNIGGNSNTFFEDSSFDGQIDEVRIWDSVLSSGDIEANFLAGPDVIGVPETSTLSFILGSCLLGLLLRRNKGL